VGIGKDLGQVNPKSDFEINKEHDGSVDYTVSQITIMNDGIAPPTGSEIWGSRVFVFDDTVTPSNDLILVGTTSIALAENLNAFLTIGVQGMAYGGEENWAFFAVTGNSFFTDGVLISDEDVPTIGTAKLSVMDGNVGIGTKNPSEKLEISGGNLKMNNGNIMLDGNYLSGDGDNEGIKIDSDGNFLGSKFIDMDDSNWFVDPSWQTALKNLNIGSYNPWAGALDVDGTGWNKAINVDGNAPYGLYVSTGKSYFANKVGIGTDSPSEMLSVYGLISMTGDPDSLDDVMNVGYADNRYIQIGDPGDLLEDDSLDFDKFEDIMRLDATTEINLGGYNLNIDLDSTGDFKILDSGTAKHIFKDNGKVGIGTSTPSSNADLTVDHILKLQPGSAPSTAEEGMIYYDSTLGLRLYKGSGWVSLEPDGCDSWCTH
jgi:hypothetical protein